MLLDPVDLAIASTEPRPVDLGDIVTPCDCKAAQIASTEPRPVDLGDGGGVADAMNAFELQRSPGP